MIKKIFGSKIFRLVASAVLIYLAFRRVNIWDVLGQLSSAPLWFVVAYLVYNFLFSMLGSYRWSLLLFNKPGWKETITFTRAAYMGIFYALFLPSSMAGDLIKWVPIHNKYPDIKKTKLLSSMLVDRFVGLSTSILVGFLALAVGKILKFSFPDYLFWLFLAMFVGIVLFYVLVFNFDIEKLLAKIPILNKLVHIVDLLKNENKSRLLRCLVVSLICTFSWILPVWFVSLVFNIGFSLMSVFIFLPIISLLLVLPISVAGFGGREYLFVFFFSQLGVADDKILLASTFVGLVGILNSLIGGFWSMF